MSDCPNRDKTSEDCLLVCPWCKEADFDDIGLKLHIINGWCPVFENIDLFET